MSVGLFYCEDLVRWVMPDAAFDGAAPTRIYEPAVPSLKLPQCRPVFSETGPARTASTHIFVATLPAMLMEHPEEKVWDTNSRLNPGKRYRSHIAYVRYFENDDVTGLTIIPRDNGPFILSSGAAPDTSPTGKPSEICRAPYRYRIQ